MTSKYQKCFVCNQSFSKLYFRRHKCISGISPYTRSDGVNDDCFDSNAQLANAEAVEVVDDREIERDHNIVDNAEILDNEEFDFLFNEIYSQEELNIDKERNDGGDVLIKWFCIVLAYWQMHFSITDNAFEFMLKVVSLFIHKITELSNCKTLQLLAQKFPASLFMFQKLLNLKKKSAFKKYVVCVKCHSLYDFDSCRMKLHGEFVSAKCCFKRFPNHLI